MRIVIAEDEQRSREGLCRLIEGLEGDYQLVGTAANGAAALDMIMSLKPDTVFTDIRMPIMDGIEVAAQVRARGVKTEFVIISGYADFEYARKSISLDVAEYLLKPVMQEDVERALKRVQERLSGYSEDKHARLGRLREQYPGAHPAVIKALDFIESNYSGRISQKELARRLEISPEYFSYLFTKCVGMTFSEFLRRFRIERAKALYDSGECPKSDVPYQVGFTDPKYFNQVFRTVTGMTASEYLHRQ